MWLELLSARYPGMRRWLIQRLSALCMVLYLLLLLCRLLMADRLADYQHWHALFSPCWWRLLTLWFFVCLLLHAWLGVRDVLRDYVSRPSIRVALQHGVTVLVGLELLAAVHILFGANF